MKLITVASALTLGLLAITGCASSEYGRSTMASDAHAAPALDLVRLEDTSSQPSFPARVTPASTPRSVARLANQVAVELGGQARTDLRLCVDGAGAVKDVALLRSSGMDALDDALIADARTWQYQAPMSATTVCHRVEIGFQVR